MKSISLPYNIDITPIFNNIARYPWSIWLDSGQNKELNQRYDIVSGFPRKIVTSGLQHCLLKTLKYDDNLNIIINSFNRFSNHNKNIFDLLKEIIPQNIKADPNGDIPFWNGAMGYLGYDLNQIIFNKLPKYHSNYNIPIAAIGIYSWALINDHKLKTSNLVYDEEHISCETINLILEKLSSNDQLNTLINNNPNKSDEINKYFSDNKLKTHISKNEYKKNFNKVKKHIYDGDCYQINYTLPFNIKTLNQNFTNWEIYQHFKKFNKNPFGCYMSLPDDMSILSYSPERFMKVNNNSIIVQPIKGTRKRVLDSQEEDNKIIDELVNSKKDRAENIMITDLLRNDINKYCKPGTVKTEKICEIKSFPTVHHLVTTITGKLNDKQSSIDILKGCFPGGSITGAPKLRAMQIIQEIENSNNSIARYAYCGSIGYINCNGTMDMNVSIRTFIQSEYNYYYWAGGGLVADSDCASEYQEILDKLIKTCSYD